MRSWVVDGFLFLLFLLLALPAAAQIPAGASTEGKTIRSALFVVVDGVYNSELMAPYDVLQHTIFRDDTDYAATAVVSPDGEPVTSFEGLVIGAHYSFATRRRPTS